MNSLRTTFARVLGTASISAFVLGIFLALQPVARAQNLVYAVTNSADFGTLDLDSGTYTHLGTSSAQLAGLGELGANLYGGELNSGVFDEVNLANGSLIQLSPGVGTHFRGFGATTATLYAINSGGDLYSIYISGISFGEPILRDVGATSLGPGTLAMSANGPVLYATLDPGTDSVLYLLNTTTGGASLIGSTGIANITSLVFRHGTLYAAAANGAIYILNTTTGQGTLHATISPTEVVVGMAVPASTFSVLHTFTGTDGATPSAGLTMDRAGNLYGTASAGGNSGGEGTVFKLTKHTGGWTFARLFAFQGSDGANPIAPVTIASSGALFGTTSGGGFDFGTVFELRVPPSFCRSIDCPWGETTLEKFEGSGQPDGPNYGGMVFDSAGNLYGVSTGGGTYGQGAVYELMPSGGNWVLSVIYSFQNNNQDGRQPYSGVIFDSSGNLYGTTRNGGANGDGTVYELSPSGDGWTPNILHSFTGTDGQYPLGGLTFVGVNTYYGATTQGGAFGEGTVFQLVRNNGSWTYTLIYSFPQRGGDSAGPYAAPIVDAAGNLYGATHAGGQGYGNVYELTPSNGVWSYTDLYEFTARGDGALPYGNLLFDSAGNLYGTASCLGNCPQGVDGTVYRLTQE